MKKLLLFSTLFFGFIGISNAQGCGQMFYDNGGASGNYTNNANLTTTICPDVATELVTVTFTSFSTEATVDALYVYDGDSTAAPLISSDNSAGFVPGGLPGGYWGNTIPGPFTSTSPSGCLTFVFRSDSSGFAAGWAAQVDCATPDECSAPIPFDVISLSSTETDFSWIPAVGTATSWEVLALPCGSPAPTALTNGIPTNATPYTFTDLIAGTCYSFYVRTICSDTDISNWAGPITTTLPIGPPVCGGNFTDNGGATGNYSANSNQTTTICPTVPGESVMVTFTSFSTEAQSDGLYVFNGNSTVSPQIASTNGPGNLPLVLPGSFWGDTIPGPFVSNSPDGCLTFQFLSDGLNTYAGWIANVTCGPMITPLLAFVDTNENGAMDDNEPYFPAGSFSYEANNSGEVHTIDAPMGYYNMYTTNPSNTYDFHFNVAPEYAAYYSASPTDYDDIGIPSATALYFPVTVTQPSVDFHTTIAPLNSPRPGMTYTVEVAYTNYATTTLTGATLTFTKDPMVVIESVAEMVTPTATGFTDAITPMEPFETRHFHVTLAVPNIPNVNLGDILTNTVAVSVPSGDLNQTNNSFSDSQVVIGSYDPNDKTESHGGRIVFNDFDADDYLYYTIRFQNTGTAEAFNVRVEDVLDAQIDESSVRTLRTSHENFVMERVGTDVAWTFNNINLPGQSQNEPASHGYIFFKARLKPGFAIGDIIPNTAEIYFDSNPAIVTDPCLTEFVNQLATPEFSTHNVRIYPNPASSVCEIKLDSNATIATVTIFDMLGKAVQKKNNIASDHTSLDVSELAKGIYQLEIVTGTNFRHVSKLVVQ